MFQYFSILLLFAFSVQLLADDLPSTLPPKFDPEATTLISPTKPERQRWLEDNEEITINNEKHRIIELLGQGGIGQIYRTENMRSGKRIAVKVVRCNSEKIAEETQRAYRLFQGLNWQDIVPVQNVEEKTIRGEIFVTHTMAVIENYTTLGSSSQRDLYRISGNNQPNQDLLNRAEDLLNQLQRIQAMLWRHGIVHHDIKPQNLVVAPNGKILLADPDLVSLTNDRVMFRGSPGFMSPDLFQEEPDSRGGISSHPSQDAFSLGATYYEMIFGQNLLKELSKATTIPKNSTHYDRMAKPFEHYDLTKRQIRSKLAELEKSYCPAQCPENVRSLFKRIEAFLTISLHPNGKERFNQLLLSPATNFPFQISPKPAACSPLAVRLMTNALTPP